MIVERILTVSVDIYNIVTLAQPDNILAMLRARYEGKCFDGCRILEVLEIIARGPAIIHPTDSRKVAVSSCKIRIRGIEFIKGEVIHDCKVVNVNDSVVVCKAKYVSIIIPAEKVRGVTTGMTISVVVMLSRYSLNESTISVSGEYFMPPTAPIYVKLSGVITECVATHLTSLLAAARAEVAGADKEGVDGFERILGPDHGQKVAGKLISVDAILANRTPQEMWIAIDPAIGIKTPNVVIADPPDGIASNSIIDRNIDDAVTEIITYKQNCLEMLARYPTIYSGEKFGEHKKLWFIHRRNHEK